MLQFRSKEASAAPTPTLVSQDLAATTRAEDLPEGLKGELVVVHRNSKSYRHEKQSGNTENPDGK